MASLAIVNIQPARLAVRRTLRAADEANRELARLDAALSERDVHIAELEARLAEYGIQLKTEEI